MIDLRFESLKVCTQEQEDVMSNFIDSLDLDKDLMNSEK